MNRNWKRRLIVSGISRRRSDIYATTETNPTNFRLSSSGFLAEIDKMQLEVREYLSLLPAQLKETA